METKNILFTIVAFTALLSGCASLVNGKYQDIKVSSNPSNATITVEPGDHKALKTPATLSLERKQGPYMLTIAMPGYKESKIYLKASTSGWVWGNVLIGGIIGMIVDHSTGAANVLEPAEVKANLEKNNISDDENTNDKLLFFNTEGRLLISVNLH